MGTLMGVTEWHPKAYWEMLCFSMLYLYLETYTVHIHIVYPGEVQIHRYITVHTCCCCKARRVIVNYVCMCCMCFSVM